MQLRNTPKMRISAMLFNLHKLVGELRILESSNKSMAKAFRNIAGVFPDIIRILFAIVFWTKPVNPHLSFAQCHLLVLSYRLRFMPQESPCYFSALKISAMIWVLRKPCSHGFWQSARHFFERGEVCRSHRSSGRSSFRRRKRLNPALD